MFDSQRFSGDLLIAYKRHKDIKNLDMFWVILKDKYNLDENIKISRHSINQLMTCPDKSRLSIKQMFYICHYFKLDLSSYKISGYFSDF